MDVLVILLFMLWRMEMQNAWRNLLWKTAFFLRHFANNWYPFWELNNLCSGRNSNLPKRTSDNETIFSCAFSTDILSRNVASGKNTNENILEWRTVKQPIYLGTVTARSMWCSHFGEAAAQMPLCICFTLLVQNICIARGENDDFTRINTVKERK